MGINRSYVELPEKVTNNPTRCKGKVRKGEKPLHVTGGEMYKQENKRQQEFESFYLPFGGKLNPRNRWVLLAKLIPWEEFEDKYAEHFAESGMGAPAKSFRIALG